MREKIKGIIQLIIGFLLVGILLYLMMIPQPGYNLSLEICFFLLTSCWCCGSGVENLVNIESEADRLNRLVEKIKNSVNEYQDFRIPLEKEKFCGYCGTKIEEIDSFYCPFCGSILKD